MAWVRTGYTSKVLWREGLKYMYIIIDIDKSTTFTTLYTGILQLSTPMHIYTRNGNFVILMIIANITISIALCIN